jgi:hypothetical protein
MHKQYQVTYDITATRMVLLLDRAWSQPSLGPIKQVDAFHNILATINAHAQFHFEEEVEILDYNDTADKVVVQERVIRHRAERLMLATKERALRRAKREEKVAEAIERGLLRPREIASLTRLPVTAVYRLKREYLAKGRAGI